MEVDESLEKMLPIRRTNMKEGIRFLRRPWKKCKYYGRCLGPGTKDVPWCTDPSDKINVECAFRKRLMPKMPRVNKDKLVRMRKFVRSFVKKWYRPLDRMDAKKAFDHWITNQHNYNEHRKDEMRDAFSSIYDDHRNLDERDYWAKMFIKSEFYEEPKNARGICSRTDRFKAFVAPYIHEIEEVVYNTKIDGHKWFVKGEVVSELPRKIKRVLKYKYKIETDFSSFESGFSPEFTDVCECELWRHMLKNNKPIMDAVLRVYFQPRKLLIGSGKTKRFIDCLKPRLEKLINVNYKAYVSGLRLSGEMWTSLGNGFSNLMIFLNEAHEKGVRLIGLVEGDDGIFSCSEKIISNEEIEEYGFKIKLQYELDPTQTCFCGNLFDPREELLIVSPEQISRLMWTCQRKYINSGKKIVNELLKCKAMSSYVQGRHTPILAHLSYKVQLLLKDSKLRYEGGNYWWDQQLLKEIPTTSFVVPTITEKSRSLYAQKFHIGLRTQLELEEQIMKATNIDDLFLDIAFMGHGVFGNSRPFYEGAVSL